MSHDRMIQAIGRIEKALGRLENLEPRQMSAAAGDPELAARHEKLKAEARATLTEIDRLLAEVRG
jgi:hypothetical protein